MTAQQKKTAGIAITSLVLGIIGLLTFWLLGLGMLCALPAVICGHIGYLRVKTSAGALAGDRLALAGLITGYIGTALSAVIIPLTLIINVGSGPPKPQNYCQNNLRLLAGARRDYAEDNSNAVATSMTQLVGSNAYIIKTPVCPAGGTYTLPPRLGDRPSCSIHGKLLPE
ncbi:MAG: DUF4190 domain-containing protein [Kiritimatiellaeota bacterium]|nr:DUF4190 domain-containing protein [Kiritimatiellota bacterium]